MVQRFTILFLIIACTTHVAHTQTLDESNTSPFAGLNLPYNQGGYLAQGPGGADQVWDLSALNITGTYGLAFVTPAATGVGAFFPDANLAQDYGDGYFDLLRSSASGLDRMGLRYNAQNSTIVYDDPERILSYPCSFNTTWTDDFSSNFSSAGQPTVRTGTITGVADGFGTVIMPYGSIENVLRVRLSEQANDINGLLDIDYDYTTHHYYKPGLRTPLVTFYELNSDNNGQQSSSTYSLWLTEGYAAVNEQISNSIGMEVFPNPSSDRISVVFGSVGGPLVLDLLDATGRVVLSENQVGAGPGIGRINLDVEALPSGLYHVRLMASNGDQGSQRVVIH